MSQPLCAVFRVRSLILEVEKLNGSLANNLGPGNQHSSSSSSSKKDEAAAAAAAAAAAWVVVQEDCVDSYDHSIPLDRDRRLTHSPALEQTRGRTCTIISMNKPAMTLGLELWREYSAEELRQKSVNVIRVPVVQGWPWHKPYERLMHQIAEMLRKVVMCRSTAIKLEWGGVDYAGWTCWPRVGKRGHVERISTEELVLSIARVSDPSTTSGLTMFDRAKRGASRKALVSARLSTGREAMRQGPGSNAMSDLERDAAEMAKNIIHQIRATTGLLACAGVSCNQLLAREACNMASNGSVLTLLFPQLETVLAKRRIDKFRPFRGLLARVLTEKFNCTTLGELLEIEESRLTRHFGERMGRMIRSRARGIDNSSARKALKRPMADYNVSSGKAFEGDCQPGSSAEFRDYLFELCYDIREKLQLKLMQDNVWPMVLELNYELQSATDMTKRTRSCVSCNVSYNSTFTVDGMYSILDKRLRSPLEGKVSYMQLACKDFVAIDKHSRHAIVDMGAQKRQKMAQEREFDFQGLSSQWAPIGLTQSTYLPDPDRAEQEKSQAHLIELVIPWLQETQDED